MTIQIRRTATPNNPPTGLDPGQLAVEMASDPPRLWCGVPVSINPSGRIEVAIGGGGGASDDFTTGDAKLTLDSEAEPGWIMMDEDGATIGDAESGASKRANDDCEALFLLLWRVLPPTYSTYFPDGRGDSAEDDWAAHKRVGLPRQCGRAPIGAGQGAGLTMRLLGSLIGEETHAPTVGEMPQHYHPVSDPTHNHAGYTNSNSVWNGYFAYRQFTTIYTGFNWWSYGQGSTINAAGTGIWFYNAGSSAPFNVIQPSTAWNIMIKL